MRGTSNGFISGVSTVSASMRCRYVTATFGFHPIQDAFCRGVLSRNNPFTFVGTATRGLFQGTPHRFQVVFCSATCGMGMDFQASSTAKRSTTSVTGGLFPRCNCSMVTRSVSFLRFFAKRRFTEKRSFWCALVYQSEQHGIRKGITNQRLTCSFPIHGNSVSDGLFRRVARSASLLHGNFLTVTGDYMAVLTGS